MITFLRWYTVENATYLVSAGSLQFEKNWQVQVGGDRRTQSVGNIYHDKLNSVSVIFAGDSQQGYC